MLSSSKSPREANHRAFGQIRRLRWLLYFSFVLLSLSCASLRQLVGWVAEKPEIKLVQIELQSFSIQRVEMVFVFDAYNPNSFALDVQSFHYKVSGLGMELGTGSLEKPFVLEGKERSQFRLPFAALPEVALKIMKKYLAQPKSLKLLVQGQLQLDTAFGRMDAHFEEEKSVAKGLPGL